MLEEMGLFKINRHIVQIIATYAEEPMGMLDVNTHLKYSHAFLLGTSPGLWPSRLEVLTSSQLRALLGDTS